tara:strand:+ start:583 stop:1140 length:558 start_codon:yes stop_codon:yes gene_type:complete
MAYTHEEVESMFDAILLNIKKGKALRDVLKEKNTPSSSTFFKWIHNNCDRLKKYNKARESIVYNVNTRCKSNPKGSKSLGLNDYRSLNASKVNKKRFPNSNIYVLKIENKDLYKIGVSQNVNRRLRDISNSMPFNVSIELNKSVEDAYGLENILHNEFKNKYIKNEWFNLNVNDLHKIMKICQDL